MRLILGLIVGATIAANQLPTMQAAERPTLAVTLDRWDAEIATAREGILPIPAARLEAAHANWVRVLTEFEHSLGELSDDQQHVWKSLLKWDDLRDSATRSLNDRVIILQRTYTVLRLDQAGFESGAVAALRDAAKQYLRALSLPNDNTAAAVNHRLDDLRRQLADVQSSPRVETIRALGDTLDWLDNAGQAGQLVQSVRAQWSQPNIVLRLSHGFVAPYGDKEVEESKHQVVNILGTITGGPTTTKGRLSIGFVPNDQVAELEIRLSADTQAPRNVGHNGPATIWSSSVAHTEAKKRLRLDSELGVVDDPASASTKTNAHLKNVVAEPKHFKHALSPLFTKVARKKSKQLESAAEAEASRITANKVSEQMDREAEESLREIHGKYQQVMITGPSRLDERPAISSMTTAEVLELRLRQAQAHQLAANTARPELSDKFSLGLAVHESFFNNVSARYLFHSASMTDEKIESLANFLTGEVPQELRVYSNSEPWMVTLNAEQPFTLTFRGGLIDLTLHTVEWRRGKQRTNAAIDIHSVYRPEVTRFGPSFVRQGEVEIRAVAGELSGEWLPFITKKANALFGPRARFNNLIAPRGGSFGKFAELKLDYLKCESGWIALGYE